MNVRCGIDTVMNLGVKVTVGLCIKDAEATIKDAMESVLSQDFPHESMELLVVDGCSRDKTLLIIRDKLKNAFIQNKVFSENCGLGHARQMVVDNADGDYIVWVDSDMILTKDYIRKQVEFMEQHPKLGIAGGEFGIFPGKTRCATLENLVYVAVSFMQTRKMKLFPRRGEQHRFIGTEGSIYRVKAVRQVGGFDTNMKGAGEDVDVAYKIKCAGWELERTDATFYESCRESWKDLWNQYLWYGYGGHYISHKSKQLAPLYEMTPLVGFLVGIVYSFIAYGISKRKLSFLIAFHYVFKRIAWCAGFIKGHLDDYGH
jgi:glycosyltransferase involved in cell wall biosynthesis